MGICLINDNKIVLFLAKFCETRYQRTMHFSNYANKRPIGVVV